MKAVVIERLGLLHIADRDIPPPGPEQVVARVDACGVCGADMHIFRAGFRADYPITPGHEFAGEVVAAGRARVRKWASHRFHATDFALALKLAQRGGAIQILAAP